MYFLANGQNDIIETTNLVTNATSVIPSTRSIAANWKAKENVRIKPKIEGII